VGACIVVTAFHVWLTWNLVGRVTKTESAINQIVAFINQNIQK